MCTGLEPARALAEVCFPVKGEMSWHTAVLGYAYLVLALDTGSNALDWVDKVLAQEGRYCALAAEWRPPDHPEWNPADRERAHARAAP